MSAVHSTLTPIQALSALLNAIADMEHAAGLDEWYGDDNDPLAEARETLWNFVLEHDTTEPEPPSAIVWDTAQPWKYDYSE